MKNISSKRLGEQKIVNLLFKLSTPAIIGMLIQALYNVVDSIYIGRLSTKALAALSLTFPVQMILISISVGTGIGANSLISRLLGKGDKKSANNTAEHVVIISVIYGIITAFFGVLFSDKILRFFTQDQVLINLGTSYIRIIMLGSIAMYIPIIFNNILRGEGNTFIPMVCMLIGAITNIILDPFMIFGIGFFPKLGVEGAAYATIIARFISGIFITIVLLSDKNEVKLNLKDFSWDKSIVKKIYKVGFPAMLMQLLASVMIGGMNKIVIRFDEVALAVVGIYFRLQSFVFMPVFGLNQGYIPIVGYNYGHNNPKRMKKTIKYGMFIGFVFTTLGFILFQFFPEQLISLFNDDKELLRLGVIALKRISLTFPIVGISIVGSATFQALGKGMPSLIISFMRQIIVLLPTMYFLGEVFGLNSLWYAFPISEVLTFIVILFWLRKTVKKDVKEMNEDFKIS